MGKVVRDYDFIVRMYEALHADCEACRPFTLSVYPWTLRMPDGEVLPCAVVRLDRAEPAESQDYETARATAEMVQSLNQAWFAEMRRLNVDPTVIVPVEVTSPDGATLVVVLSTITTPWRSDEVRGEVQDQWRGWRFPRSASELTEELSRRGVLGPDGGVGASTRPAE